LADKVAKEGSLHSQSRQILTWNLQWSKYVGTSPYSHGTRN